MMIAEFPGVFDMQQGPELAKVQFEYHNGHIYLLFFRNKQQDKL
jgi:hypothetical protein